jgi:hypothetical protein
MPRTALVETPAAINAGTLPTANAVDPTNGHTIPFGKARKLVLRINSTFAGAKNFTFLAGAYPPSGKAGQGNLVLAINAAVRYVTVSADRFKQADGNLYIDVEAAATGSIEAVRLPAGL